MSNQWLPSITPKTSRHGSPPELESDTPNLEPICQTKPEHLKGLCLRLLNSKLNKVLDTLQPVGKWLLDKQFIIFSLLNDNITLTARALSWSPGCGRRYSVPPGAGEEDRVIDGWDWVPEEDPWWGVYLHTPTYIPPPPPPHDPKCKGQLLDLANEHKTMAHQLNSPNQWSVTLQCYFPQNSKIIGTLYENFAQCQLFSSSKIVFVYKLSRSKLNLYLTRLCP